ncbi:hypothetical protein C0585_04750 [Candidatus Woesearchaeota archaeon]|nr:MAG: hypothetical protein C0585_04750 [Candidatus Woesearchaeota archaeon]
MPSEYLIPEEIKEKTQIAFDKANKNLEEPLIHQASITYFTPHIFKFKHFYSNDRSHISLYFTLDGLEKENLPFDINDKEKKKDEIHDLTQIIFQMDFPNKKIKEVECRTLGIISPKEQIDIISPHMLEYLIKLDYDPSGLKYGSVECFDFATKMMKSSLNKYPLIKDHLTHPEKLNSEKDSFWKGLGKLFLDIAKP